MQLLIIFLCLKLLIKSQFHIFTMKSLIILFLLPKIDRKIVQDIKILVLNLVITSIGGLLKIHSYHEFLWAYLFGSMFFSSVHCYASVIA